MRTTKMLLQIFLSMVATLAALLIVQNVIPREAIGVNIDTWTAFFTVFGIIYAIIVGLLLVEVSRRFHSLSSTVEAELNAIEDIRDFLIYVDKNKEAKKEIRQALLNYLNSLIDKERGEWGKMKKKSQEISSDTSQRLYQLMEAVHKIKVTNKSDDVALSAIIGKIADVTTYRTTRLELTSIHLRPALRALIIFMSVILVVGFLLLNVGSIWTHALITLSVVIATHLLYLVISDFDHPFSGFWNIEAKPFEEVADRLARKNQLYTGRWLAGRPGSTAVAPK